MEYDPDLRITLIGAGTIGLSFAAFHLNHLSSPSQLTIYDTRPDLENYIQENLSTFSDQRPKIRVSKNLEEAIKNADIIQESGPENLEFKRELWSEVEKLAGKDALLWSSTSGIPASQQSLDMRDKSRVLVVHPYNPPHIMPLLEVVPSPETGAGVIERTQQFWRARGRVPVILKKEMTGFVANRLAFALLREAIHLVNEGVVSVEEIDSIVESSMGPRWAVAGPFKSYHAGGGAGGLEAFFKNIGGTVQACWMDSGDVRVGEGWEEKVFRDAKMTYGTVDLKERDQVTSKVLEVIEEERSKKASLS